MTKVTIISGFLGAGKTTLIKKLLRDCFQGEKAVLIENEFGEIGIDSGFLKDAGIEIREMNSGCICCSLVGDFGTALREVLKTYEPERIIIEPSGVGKLSDVAKAVLSSAEDGDLEITSLTTVVDVKKCKMYLRNFGEFFENQVEYADSIVLSRTDIADEQQIQEAVSLLKEKMKPDATLVTTPIGQLSGATLLSAIERTVTLADELMEEEADHDHEEHHHHDHEEHHHDHDHEHEGHHHHADEVFTSWGCETAKTFTREQISQILDALSSEEYGMVLRAKGMVESTDGSWIYFDMVPEETDIRGGEPEYTGRFCVIGSDLKEEKLAGLFGVAS